jgi:hypothetical protein
MVAGRIHLSIVLQGRVGVVDKHWKHSWIVCTLITASVVEYMHEYVTFPSCTWHLIELPFVKGGFPRWAVVSGTHVHH